ncbi:hypothetical protein CLOLEP_03926 [[Clostridium] leptum DSM 753]|uniref:Uncharacterized protein n=1 Tax=[Clostridium] leptum DSM 753 TaxID=428125 RepID=A7VZ97_9FIRM|nr:hypothetical protein CLOLEP_03926 [[Clostridium] leptum DSM 753]
MGNFEKTGNFMKSIGTLENNVETLYNIFKPALPKP